MLKVEVFCFVVFMSTPQNTKATIHVILELLIV